MWSRENLIAVDGHIDWFDHVTSDRVTHLQFSPNAHRPQLGLGTWEGQLYLYARDQDDGTWQNVSLNLLLTRHEKDTNHAGAFIQFTPSGKYFVACMRGDVILADTCQNARHKLTRLQLQGATDCIKGVVLVVLDDMSGAVFVLTRSRDLYCLPLPLPFAISGDECCLAQSSDSALFLHHSIDWLHSPLQLSVRHSDGRHASFTCPHVCYGMLDTALNCAVHCNYVILAVGPQLLLYEAANDTWRCIFTKNRVLGVCFLNGESETVVVHNSTNSIV